MKIVYLFIAFLLLTTACRKSAFLRENPEDRFVTENFYSGPKDAQAAVDAVYHQLYSIYQRNMILLNDLPTDDEKNGIGMPNQFLIDLEFLRFTAENTFVRDMWSLNYSGIQRANSAINNIGRITMEESLKNRLLGEASFLRALYYFNLVRFYGDVPLIVKLESLQDALIPRTPKEEVYKLVIADLQFAENNLPKTYTSTNLGRATSGAAKILLGKVYLTMRDFQKSAGKLEEVVQNESSFGYGLHADFKDNWKIATENGKEAVFSVQMMQPPGTPNGQMVLQGPKFSVPGGQVPGLVGNEADIPTMDLYNKYITGDTRKDVTFKLEFVSPSNGRTYKSSIPLFGKYWEEGETIAANCDVNFHVLRYSDALLMYAEALNETGNTAKAIGVLNRVRERAFRNVRNNYTASTQSAFRDQVYLERRLEFANEGQRWFDLARTNRLFTTMKAHGTLEAQLAESNKTTISANAKEYQVLYPVPQREMDLNKLLIQNQGY